MDREQIKTTARGIGIVNLILGIWLIVSPLIFGFSGGATANSATLGIIVAILAIIRLSTLRQAWASWLNGIAGIWLILAPFILGTMEPAVLWNDIIVGIVVAVLGFWNGTITVPLQQQATHHRTM